MKSCSTLKSVHVCAYVRYKHGHLERVCEHWRSLPMGN